MAASASAYNTTDTPVVIDGEGRRLDGQTHGKVDPGLPEVAAAVLAGSLVVSDHVAGRIEDARDDDVPAPAPPPVELPGAGTPAPTPVQKGPRR